MFERVVFELVPGMGCMTRHAVFLLAPPVVEAMVERVKELLTAAQDWEQQARTALKQK